MLTRLATAKGQCPRAACYLPGRSDTGVRGL